MVRQRRGSPIDLAYTPTKTDGKRSWPEDLRIFVRFCRLRYLAYSVLVHLMGAAAALADETINVTKFKPVVFMKMQMVIWWVHIVTHWANDYYDLRADSLNTKRGTYNGGSGVLVDGLITPEVAFYSAWIGTIIAIMYVALLNLFDAESPFRGEVPIVVALSFIISWQYTAPPFRLQYRGFGELCIVVVFAIMIPLMGAVSQIGDGKLYVPMPLRTVIPLHALQQFARMIIMNAPDIDSDLPAGKMTFTARIGLHRASIVYAIIQLIVTVLPPIFVAKSLMPIPVAMAFTLVAPQGWTIAKGIIQGARENTSIAMLPFKGTLQVVSQAALLLSAMLFLAYQRSMQL